MVLFVSAVLVLTFLKVYMTGAEPGWPSGNTLAFNAEDPGSTPGPGVR